MRKVFKYPLTPGRSEVDMDPNGEVLTVQEQFGDACMWALVDPNAPIARRVFLTCGTGHEVSEDWNLVYAGTIQVYEGRLVFHVFEVLS